jgi:hypothetical protein
MAVDAQQQLQHFQTRLDDLEHELLMYQTFATFLSDSTNQANVEAVINIFIDDFSNIFATMPSDSFSELSKMVGFAVQSFMGNGPSQLPLTADDLNNLAHDLSTFLGMYGDTISSTDMTTITDLVHSIAVAYVDSMNLTDPEYTDKINYIDDMFAKYYGFFDTGRTQLVAILDSLTPAKIQMILDTADYMNNHKGSIYSQIVTVSNTLSSLLSAPGLDVHTIVNDVLDVYFDQKIVPDTSYTGPSLTDVQTAWDTYIDGVITQINTIGALDPSSIDPADLGAILTLQKSVEYMKMFFDDPTQIISNPFVAPVYDHQQFVDVIMKLFKMQDTTAIDDLITQITQMTGLTEEQTYYQFVGIAEMVQQMVKSGPQQGVMSLMNMISSLKALGIDSSTLASYGMTIFMDFIYPNIPNFYDTTKQTQEQQQITDDINNNLQPGLDQVDNDVATEVANLLTNNPNYSSSNLDVDAENYWLALKDYNIAQAGFDYATSKAQNNNSNFDWGYFEYLKGLYDMNPQSLTDELNNMNQFEFDTYNWVMQEYISMKTAETKLQQVEQYFNSTYWEYGVYTSQSENFSSFIYNEISIYMPNYWNLMNQQMRYDQLQNEIDRINNETKPAWDAIQAFFSVQQNVDDTEHMLNLLLDEFDNLTSNPDFAIFQSTIGMIMRQQIPAISVDNISADLIATGSLLSGLFSTWDATDITFIEGYLNTVLDAVIDFKNPADPTTLKSEIADLITNHFEDMLSVPGVIGTFLQSMDPAKTQTVIYDIMGIAAHNYKHFNGQDPASIILMSELVNDLFSDGSFDHITFLTAIVGTAVDIKLLVDPTYDLSPDTSATDVVNNAIDYIDAILADATYLANFDPNNLTFDWASTISDLMTNGMDFGSYLQPFFGGGN